jgi:hypothetical protein
MYGLCMFMLLREGKTPPLRWILIIMSTILFLLCTAHVGASLRQLLEAFVYVPADIPNYSTTYWLDYAATPCLLKDILYSTLVLAQDFILIWRLYTVFMYNWKITIIPVILTAGCVGSAYAASALSSRQDHALLATPSLLISAWAFGFTLNVFVTLAITGRLWWMGRTIAALTATSTNRFTYSIYIVVESGAISVVAGTVVLALYANPAALTGLDVATQLVALAPLLIVVQLGLTGQTRIPQGNSSKTAPTVQDEIIFRSGIPQEQDSRNDLKLHAIATRFRSEHDAHV